MTDKRIYRERVKKVKNALCANGAQEHCGSTWEELMETDAFFIMSLAINAPVSQILLRSWKWLPVKQNLYVFWGRKWKVFQNRYVIARDLKILRRYTAQSDVGSIEKCIWFTAGEMEDGSIISKFPEIARAIDYLISHFSQKVHQRTRDEKTAFWETQAVACKWANACCSSERRSN